jgi:hypothetical protein
MHIASERSEVRKYSLEARKPAGFRESVAMERRSVGEIRWLVAGKGGYEQSAGYARSLAPTNGTYWIPTIGLRDQVIVVGATK